MLTVHHLNDSRSQRILWLLEELGVPYEIKHYARDAATRLAPPELVAVHRLGKSPVVTEDGHTIIESGAIIDYIVRKHGGGKLVPAAGSADFETWNQWLHYAEGSAMLPLMLAMYTGRLGEAAAPLKPRIDSETANHLGYVEASLAGRDWLVGNALSAADSAPLAREALGTLTMPVLVVAGRHDELAGDPDELAAVFPRGKGVTLPGCDHFSAIPHGLLKATVFDFLDGMLDDDFPDNYR
jgi:glutathione S-transferase